MAVSRVASDWQCSKGLIECLEHMLTAEVVPDVTFRIGENKSIIHAHKFMLICRSPVFFAMFEGLLPEKGAIDIPDIDPDIFRMFIRYLYTDQIDLTCHNVSYIMAVAKKYFVDQLTTKCVDFFRQNLTPENACVLLEHAHVCYEVVLNTECRNFINENPSKCLNASAVKDLCYSCLLSITESDDLKTTEDVVFKAIMKWSESECERQNLEVTDDNRRMVLRDVFYTVRYPVMNRDFLLEEVLKHHLLTDKEATSILRVQSNILDASEVKFKSTPRKKAQGPVKVVKTSNERNVYYATYCKDTSALTFEVSGLLFFHGVKMFGGKEKSKKSYECTMKLYDDEDSLLCSTEEIISEVSAVDNMFSLMTDKPVPLVATDTYTVVVTLQGTDGERCEVHSTSNSLRESFHMDDGTNVIFSKSNLDKNDGKQLPALLLSSAVYK